MRKHFGGGAGAGEGPLQVGPTHPHAHDFEASLDIRDRYFRHLDGRAGIDDACRISERLRCIAISIVAEAQNRLVTFDFEGISDHLRGLEVVEDGLSDVAVQMLDRSARRWCWRWCRILRLDAFAHAADHCGSPLERRQIEFEPSFAAGLVQRQARVVDGGLQSARHTRKLAKILIDVRMRIGQTNQGDLTHAAHGAH